MNSTVVLVLVVFLVAGGLMTMLYIALKTTLLWKINAVFIPAMTFTAALGFVLGHSDGGVLLYATIAPAGIAVVVIPMFIIRQLATRPLVPLTESMRVIAEDRDLTQLPTVSDRLDEIHTMQVAARTMTEELRGVVAVLQRDVAALASSTSRVADTAGESASTATAQASIFAEINTTVEKIQQTSRATADRSQQVADASNDALEKGKQGAEVLSEAADVMKTIAERVSRLAERLEAQKKQNVEISAILQSVNDLAEQSNLLAINASIEAAKAGSHGRGFAVVANEVRVLSEKSKNATTQIDGILGEMQRSSSDLIEAAKESKARVDDGHMAAETIIHIIDGLLSVLEQNSCYAREISAASEQQAASIQQVADAMEYVAAGGQHAASNARTLEQSVGELRELGQRLQSVVSTYRA